MAEHDQGTRAGLGVVDFDAVGVHGVMNDLGHSVASSATRLNYSLSQTRKKGASQRDAGSCSRGLQTAAFPRSEFKSVKRDRAKTAVWRPRLARRRQSARVTICRSNGSRLDASADYAIAAAGAVWAREGDPNVCA